MKHLTVVSKPPVRAQDISSEVMIEFIIAVLTALIPVILEKNPQPES